MADKCIQTSPLPNSVTRFNFVQVVTKSRTMCLSLKRGRRKNNILDNQFGMWQLLYCHSRVLYTNSNVYSKGKISLKRNSILSLPFFNNQSPIYIVQHKKKHKLIHHSLNQSNFYYPINSLYIKNIYMQINEQRNL